jgi:hypothetical protein
MDEYVHDQLGGKTESTDIPAAPNAPDALLLLHPSLVARQLPSAVCPQHSRSLRVSPCGLSRDDTVRATMVGDDDNEVTISDIG